MWYTVEQKTPPLNDIMTLTEAGFCENSTYKVSTVVTIYSFPLPSLNYITL